VLPVRAEPIAPDHPDAFRLDHLQCACTIRRAADGGEQLLLAEGPRCIRIEVRAGTVLAGPVRLVYDLQGFETLDARLHMLRQLLALHRLGRLPSSLFPAEPRARHWAMALQAFDGRRAGASQREIAIVLFGVARVMSEWSKGDDMHKRVSRLLRTADRLISGGGPDRLRRRAV
jgi:hypothetical protein